MSAPTDADETVQTARSFHDGPYAIKWLSAAAKKLIYEAARRERVTIGQWIEGAASGRVAAQKAKAYPTPDGYRILPPDQPATPLPAVTFIDPPPPPSIEDIGHTIALARQLGELGGEAMRPKQTQLLGRCHKLLMAHMQYGLFYHRAIVRRAAAADPRQMALTDDH